MLLSKNIGIHSVISGTWKHFLFTGIICTVTYIGYNFVNSPNWDFPILLPSILGTALAFFIGFNNNQAYDRWWEARKVWGEIVNDSRSYARQLLYYTKNDPNDAQNKWSPQVEQAIKRHIAWLYALNEFLRDNSEKKYHAYLSQEDIDYIEGQSNKHNALLNLQTKELENLYAKGLIDGFRFMQLSGILTRFSDTMGKSERIKKTVFPTIYGFYTYLFIWVFIVTVTVVSEESLGIWAILVGMLIGYVFLTTHKIGKSLVNPFDNIPSSVPINQITRSIEINLLELLEAKDIPDPYPSVDGEYVM